MFMVICLWVVVFFCFFVVVAVSRYITLYLGQQLEVCFCLSGIPFWCVKRPGTTQGGLFPTPSYKFCYEFCKCGEEVCTPDALRAHIIVARTPPTHTHTLLSDRNSSIPSISSHHIFTLEYFLSARPAFWCLLVFMGAWLGEFRPKRRSVRNKGLRLWVVDRRILVCLCSVACIVLQAMEPSKTLI